MVAKVALSKKKKGKVGGKRKGAGRPIGAKNKVTREAIDYAKKMGAEPLKYMLRIMNQEKPPKHWEDNLMEWDKRRDSMAVAAGPYVHHKLTAITHAGDPLKPITHIHKGMTPLEASQAFADFIKKFGGGI